MTIVYTQLPLFVLSKVCYGCNPPTEKPLEEFHKNNTRPDGRATQCKDCAKKYHKKHYPEVRETQIAQEREKYQRDRDKVLARQKVYGKANPEKRRDQQRKRLARPEHREYRQKYYDDRYATYPEKKQARIEQRLRWRENNRIREAQTCMRRVARKKNLTVSEVSYDRILERDGYNCHICGGVVMSDDIHFDHVIPLSRNGSHSEDNIKISHSVCNMRKGSRFMEELTPYQKRGVSYAAAPS